MPREYAPRSTKRKTHDFDDHHDDNSAPQHAHARKKITLPKKEHKYPSVNELKKRIRDVKRLLNKADLPADARIVQERALSGYEKDLEDELKRRDRSKMIKKYHFVRFLDRKTATKEISRLQRLEKETNASTTLSASTKTQKLASLAEKLRVARVNLNYTIYYPLAEKYIALYAAEGRKKEEDKKEKKDKKKAQGEEDDSEGEGEGEGEGRTRHIHIHATLADKPAMWHVVEKCMREKTLDLLREGKLDGAGNSASASVGGEGKKEKGGEKSGKKNREEKPEKARKTTDDHRKKAKTSATAAAAAAAAKDTKMQDDGDDSDGGFFEM
ncbi:hypothetical protein BO70DRAFT_329317 [Aspergillus heteromorphus CBS 117.55]|uniref:rRNA-processing protein EFG1 n=1 Tax=Aspergillus heteromorphus CBS 117.55 TaxID=1448321 RepID=A0A317WXG2_9EURO|nr:uncharacterized protein BO70DRAFT_329317 [Aspergillus heteromorphus CBS 117.55]PWY91079.1 hypothetical protein BO70DRAFT_329317 [Aspergillus heteromorphus CBS 117.55]